MFKIETQLARKNSRAQIVSQDVFDTAVLRKLDELTGL
jgi:hypothetical protein